MTQKRRPLNGVRERIIDGHRVVYDDKTARRMSNIRQKDTTPEMAVRRILAALGLRYRVRNRDLPGSPDIANRAKSWAIFVHGCYWHRHDCSRATTPKRNTQFWRSKFAANVVRDRDATVNLRHDGFRVLTIWECQTERSDVLLSIAARFSRKVTDTLVSVRLASRIEDKTSRPSGFHARSG